MHTAVCELPVNPDLVVGCDFGGTLTRVATEDLSIPSSLAVVYYPSSGTPSVEAVLDTVAQEAGARPAAIHVGMAGPRDKDTGAITTTNTGVYFHPGEASAYYGVPIEADGDVASAMGALLPGADNNLDIVELKSGNPPNKATKLLVTFSTGVGAAIMTHDRRTGQVVIAGSEGGHIGVSPLNDSEHDYVTYVHEEHGHPSAEHSLAGGHGVDGLIDHTLQAFDDRALGLAIGQARAAGIPTGEVLYEHALRGNEAAREILRRMGAMIGSVLRSLALAVDADEVYLMGSVSVGLAEYLATETAMIDRFIHEGGTHAEKLRDVVPIRLITNKDVGVLGALELAKRMRSDLVASQVTG